MTLYKFPDDSNVLGPMQLDTQIEQDERISKEIESLNVNGTKITKNMIIVPIDNTLLYIEPIYQQYINEENALPTLKKIVVASGNKVAIGNNLKEALANLVSQYAVDIEVENTDSVEDLVTAIIKANKNLQTSTDNSDWEMMGKDMKKLQELITKLEVVQKEEKEKANEIANQTKNTVDGNSTNTNVINNNYIKNE
ncbi:MAG: COG1615 family transporter [Clostridia bacterium]|nr:COG1615 family transporter [Clostridia bacterium]